MKEERCSIKEMLTGISADAVIETMKALDTFYFKDSIQYQVKHDSLSAFWCGVYAGIARESFIKGKITTLAYDTIFNYLYYESV